MQTGKKEKGLRPLNPLIPLIPRPLNPLQLVPPLVQPVARHPQLAGKLHGFLVTGFHQPDSLELELPAECLSLGHRTPPQAVSAFLGVRQTGGTSVRPLYVPIRRRAWVIR
jgi:hypothetical protein